MVVNLIIKWIFMLLLNNILWSAKQLRVRESAYTLRRGRKRIENVVHACQSKIVCE